MKTRIFLIILLVLLTITLVAVALWPQQTPHGGIVMEADEYYIETKTVYPFFYAYLLDKELKPTSNKKIHSEVQFLFDKGSYISMPLTPYNDDGFAAEIETIEFTSSVISFSLNGRTVSAKFDNQIYITQSKNH